MSWSSVSGVLLYVLFMDEDLLLLLYCTETSMFFSHLSHIVPFFSISFIGSMHGEVSFYLYAKGTNNITAGCALVSLHL